MNICFINPTKKLTMGLESLVKELSKNPNYNIFVLTPKNIESPFKNKNVKLLFYDSVFIPKIRYTIPNIIKQYLILKKLIRDEKIDIIHCWSYFYPVNWMPVLIGKKLHIPLISTIDSYPGINWHYGVKIVDFFASIYSKIIGKVVLKKMERVALLGNYLRRTAKKMDLNNIEVIPNGIDLEKFNPRINSMDIRKEFHVRNDEILILSVTRLVPVKGIEKIINIHKALKNKGYKIKSIVVGDGPYRKKYEKKSYHKDIIFTGFRSDIPEFMAGCDIFILTSLSEGLPATVREASACCKPVVASDIGGISDMIINNKTGFLIRKCDDYKNFLPKIEVLIKDRKLRRSMGVNGVKHIKQNFNWINVVKKYEKLYLKVRG